jgi:hypothetical protein
VFHVSAFLSWKEEQVDRETLIRAIDDGPVRVYMNDGQSFEIADHKSCMVDDMKAYVLFRAEDGKLRSHWLSLVCMTRIEPIVATA